MIISCRSVSIWLFVAGLISLGLAGVGGFDAHAQASFYEATDQDFAGKPGTIIRQEPITGAPLGATAYRVLYRSTGLKGEPIAVSGAVIIPRSPPPPGGRAIVGWAHPTSGIVPHCAPSRAHFLFQQIQGLRDMVEHGYIVAATDYPGLGTPGPHPYLVGLSEGRAVLDIVRAARDLDAADAGRRFALWGHSQGGQAVLFAGSIARSYTPELDLVGVAAAAPATDLGTLLRNDLGTAGGKNLLAMTLWSWSRVYGAPIDKVVDPDALRTIGRLADVCLESPVDIGPRASAGKALERRFLRVDDLTETEPWRSLLAENTIGTLPAAIPVFLAQGTDDDTIEPAVTAAYMRQLCAAGSRVNMLIVRGVGHGLIAMKSARSAVEWMERRFAGDPQTSDCGIR